MSAAAVAAGAVAVESQNIVGVVSTNSISDNNFRLVAFFTPGGYNTATVGQITISDGGLGGVGWGSEIFSIWQGIPTVAEGSELTYLDPSMDLSGEATGYYWADGNFADASAYVIQAGQAVALNLAEGLSVNVAGQVPVTNSISFTSIADNNFTGNPFPEAITVGDITISDGGLGGVGWGSEIFSIWEGIPTVAEGSELTYLDPSMDLSGTATDYYWADGTFADASDYPIEPGQGVVLNLTEGLEVAIASPY